MRAGHQGTKIGRASIRQPTGFIVGQVAEPGGIDLAEGAYRLLRIVARALSFPMRVI